MRPAAGLRTLLCEQHDLASHTSSASTKLIHGGLRYLEFYDFRLVRKSLREREVVINSAPHIVWPLRFVLPHDAHQRPAWMIRTGLFFYDHLARRKLLPGSEGVDLRTHPAGAPLDAALHEGIRVLGCMGGRCADGRHHCDGRPRARRDSAHPHALREARAPCGPLDRDAGARRRHGEPRSSPAPS